MAHDRRRNPRAAQALEDYCPPLPEAFEAQAALTADGAAEAYKASLDDPSGFWASEADRYHWQTPFDRTNVYSANFKRSAGPIAARWFEDGATNIAYNCLDRQVEAGLGDKLCFIAERNDEGETSPLQPETYTYAEALEETKKLAAALRAKGVKKGDRVALFMPMVPELAIAMLACARIGAVHTVVFGGFSRDSLASRIASAGATCVIAADGVRRGGKVIDLWGIAKDALASVFLRRPSFVFVLLFFARPCVARRALGLAPPWGAPPPRRLGVAFSRHADPRASWLARRPRRTPSTPTRLRAQARDQGTPVEGGAVILRRLDDAAYPEPELAADEAWWHDVVTSTDNSDVEWMAGRGPALHPLHVRAHRRAQGHRPRDGRLHGRRGPLVPDGLRRADARGRRLVLYCGELRLSFALPARRARGRCDLPFHSPRRCPQRHRRGTRPRRTAAGSRATPTSPTARC